MKVGDLLGDGGGTALSGVLGAWRWIAFGNELGSELGETLDISEVSSETLGDGTELRDWLVES